MGFDRECFCELAPLYALDLLDESEKLWVEEQLQKHPELAEELAEYQIAIAAIPYSAPEVEMADDLKSRLFARLDLELPDWEVPQLTAQSQIPLKMPNFEGFPDIKWTPHPTPGVEIAVFNTDLVKREIIGLLRAAPGVQYPVHCHAAREELHMLWGDLVVGDRVYTAGECIVSEPGSTHAPYTNGGCMFFFRTSIDDRY